MRNHKFYWIVGTLWVLLIITALFIDARDNTTRSPTVAATGDGGNAETVDGVDSAQFLRSDVSDTHSSGTLSVGTVDINGGNIDGTVIGGTTPAAVTTDSLTATTADINGGNIDGTVLSAASMVTGDFSFKSVVRHDVRAYGAVGNGITDDTVAIQNAINAAKNYYNPGVVFFPAGDYLISSTLVIDRRVNIIGCGRGSQIFQSSDAHLFRVSPYIGGAAHNLYMADLTLGSAATTAGNALIYLDGSTYSVSGGVYDRITMAGGSYGVRMNNAHNAVFNRLVAYSNISGFFGTCAASTRWVTSYETDSNAATFNSPDLEMAGWAFYWTAGEVLSINGGIIQGGTNTGVYFEGVDRLTLNNCHFESNFTNVHLTGCTNANLFQIGQGGGTAVFDGCRAVNIQGCKFSGSAFTIKPNCESIVIDGVRYGSTTVSIAPGTTRVHGLESSLIPTYRKAGESGYSIRNLADGDVEVWSSGYPVGFEKWDNVQVVASDNTIVKDGAYSAKVTVGAGRNKAGLLFSDFDYNKYAELYLNSYRTLEWTWTLSALGTNEYYLRDATNADPDLCGQPEGVKVNGSWATEGSGDLVNEEWNYTDRDSLGYNTIYVRYDGGDIDAEAVGFVEATFTLAKVTLSAYIYKESGSGNPYLGMEYTGGIGGTARQYAGFSSVLLNQWTRVALTFDVLIDHTVAKPMLCNMWYNQGTPGDTCYWDCIELVEGDAVSPVFDDSRKGDFSDSGGVGLPVYTNATRPAANTVPAGFMIWNSDDSAPNFSDGSNWYDAAGAGT